MDFRLPCIAASFCCCLTYYFYTSMLSLFAWGLSNTKGSLRYIVCVCGAYVLVGHSIVAQEKNATVKSRLFYSIREACRLTACFKWSKNQYRFRCRERERVASAENRLARTLFSREYNINNMNEWTYRIARVYHPYRAMLRRLTWMYPGNEREKKREKINTKRMHYYLYSFVFCAVKLTTDERETATGTQTNRLCRTHYLKIHLRIHV